MSERVSPEELKAHQTTGINRQEIKMHLGATQSQVVNYIRHASTALSALRKVHSLPTEPMFVALKAFRKALMNLQNNLNATLTRWDKGFMYDEEALKASQDGLAKYWEIVHASEPWMISTHFTKASVNEILTTYYQAEQ